MQGRVRVRSRLGVTEAGGVIAYPLENLYQEVAYLAYHLHWSLDEILEMEHRERAMWVEQVSAINERINRESMRRW